MAANRHDMIVVGASAGGVEALKNLARQLPENLPAAIFVIMHLPARGRSYLPEILASAGTIPVVVALDGAPIIPGRIYVPEPDHHLLIANDHIHLTRGPKESRQRPSINVTFRSAAMAYGERVIGVVLTGMLDDGTAGLWEIKARGGITVVQNPEDAAFASMPESALADVQVDYMTKLANLGELLTLLVGSDAMSESRSLKPPASNTVFSGLTCPECRGPIWQVRSQPTEFRCRVGHVYSSQTMLEDHSATQERKLYEAVLCLEEGADLAEFMAARVEGENRDLLMLEAEQIRVEADTIKQLISNRKIAPVR